MGIKDSNKFGRIDVEKLKLFELDNKLSLPPDYRAYLIKHNGGKPCPNHFKIPFSEGDISRIHHCYGLHSGPTYLRLDYSYQTYLHRIPMHLLPIADDPFGNLILIGTAGNVLGKVYFWEHELENETCSFAPMKLLSDTFGDFLISLYNWKNPNEREIEKAIKSDDVNLLNSILSAQYDLEEEDEFGRTMIENAAIHNSLGIIQYLYGNGASLRDSLKYAKQNAEFFEEHKKAVSLIISLEKK